MSDVKAYTETPPTADEEALGSASPVVVLTRDPLARLAHSVIVGPVTSTVRGRSTEVGLSEADGVRTPCVVNLDNIQLVPRRKLVRRVGRPGPGTLAEICAAAAEAIGCRAA